MKKGFFTLLLPIVSLTQVYAVADRIAADQAAAQYRTGKIDPNVLKVPARIQSALSKSSPDSVKDLTAFLVTGAADDFARVKRIHDWITENVAYDNDGFYGDGRASDPLKERRATCGGFAGLFLQMANFAGLKAVSITGRSRVTFDSKVNAMAKHVWNAVEISGKWYIVDTTHDDRFGYSHGAFGKKGAYRDTQLFISPEAKIVENYPDDQAYQFLAQPKSFAAFLAFPHVNMNFLRHGLSFAGGAATGIHRENLPGRGSRYLSVTESVRPGNGVFTLRLNAPAGVALFARVMSSAGKPIEGHALCSQSGAMTECAFSAPGNGEYNAYVSARETAVDKLYTKVYEFKVAGTDGAGQQLPLPNQLALLNTFYEYGLHITQHNLTQPDATEYFLEVEYPATANVFSTLWDENDRKIAGSSTASKPEASGDKLRVRFSYSPRAGTSLVKLRVKPAAAKMYNDTAAIVRISR